ncbi:MAG: hypothetical protein LKG27_05255 [Clostridiaceae bacterium]|jgi:hypothetical protein|nr:hypothetical protein [Clostridiaceae bacterium]
MNKVLTFSFLFVSIIGVFLYFLSNNAYSNLGLTVVMLAISTILVVFMQDEDNDRDVFTRWIA